MPSGFPATVLGLWVAVALLAPWLPTAPDRVDLPLILAPPGADAWLGCDDLGRPILDRLIAGTRTSCFVALGVVALSLAFGTLVGTASAYRGGLWDHTIVRIMDVFLAFPGILLAIALAGILGPGIGNLVIALAAVGWVSFARLARGQALSLKHREHIQAAVALGTPTGQVLLRHVLPLISAPLIVEASFGIASIAVAEAGLSFLGLGVQPPQASWGSMIRDGTRYMLVAPHMVLAPGLTLMAVVLSANLLGDRLRDWMDVKQGR